MPKPSHSFNVILSPSEHTTLRTLADICHMSKGAVTRQAILAAAKMSLHSIPTCADGSHCMCPHLVPRSSASLQQTIPDAHAPKPEDSN